MNATLPATAFRQRLLGVAPAIEASRQALNALDAKAGDGDIGESLSIGFAAVVDALSGTEVTTIGADLRQTGTVLGRVAPSTFGTLIGMALRDAGAALADCAELGGTDVVTLLESVADGVARRGEVGPGDRTVLDAVVAARDRTREAEADGAEAALRAMAAGAVDGALATAEMVPRVGRAGWVGDRARGIVDAGAAAWAVISTGVAGDDTGLHDVLADRRTTS
ncbi:DAK2 domain-containing protein [Desertimonas flava]|uniref:DAK2 domain-containing protein n=1 Tax=Desertimonas flava TaxID=2064846 RepID=UPI0013C40144|nr:DAK2 domain-containing protein [Desertimonas flava]